MTARHATLLIGAAAGALTAAAPAAAQTAQPEMPYEYAYPVPESPESTESPQDEVIFREDPVVQPLPGAEQVPAPAQPAPPPPEPPLPPAPPELPPPPPSETAYEAQAYPEQPPYPEGDEYEYEYDYDYDYDHGPAYADAPLQPPVGHHGAPPPEYRDFDRHAWLEDCRARYRTDGGRRDGEVAGGLIGAAAGGLIGNRVADGERLAGTLIGAGVGGLAGLAVGSAIGAASDRDRAEEYCEAWLERYPHGYAHGPAQPYPYAPAYPAPAYPAPYGYPAGYYGANCGCAPAFTYMPVLVAVPQRAVVREYVTEEWVEVEHEAAPPPKRRAIHKPAPRPDKRIKHTKGK